MLSKLSKVLAVAGTYQGRDKIVRLITYLLYIARGSAQRQKKNGDLSVVVEAKISILIQELSNLRVMLRLFDDLYMLKFSLSYGLGSKEKDNCCRYLQVLQNMADQMYYPIEHIAWARDLKICKGDSSQLWDVGCGLWVMSLTFGIMKTLRKLCLLEKQEQACKNAYDKPQPSDQNGTQSRKCSKCSTPCPGCRCAARPVADLRAKQTYLLIDLVENVADVINGIHWLPQGFLWASKMSSQSVGIFGTISSLCQLFKVVHPL